MSEKTEQQKKDFAQTQALLAAACLAVHELSNHLQKVGDKPRMYKANRALHVLWEIE